MLAGAVPVNLLPPRLPSTKLSLLNTNINQVLCNEDILDSKCGTFFVTS